jgi:hypothetical protein
LSIYYLFQNSLSLTEDSGISESGDNDNEETILIKLRRLAQDLENKLTPDSHLLREITEVSYSVVSNNRHVKGYIAFLGSD